ncbi:MAG TPA: GntR family transcriptional regulator [Firmicutes bacterium]|nr:GntR family transcriptional regulator [Bacillota bacterium]
MARRDRLYLGVVEELTSRIRSGRIKPGEKLKSEPELAGEFNVSRGTIREALGCLEFRGLIARTHGIGSFVVGQPHEVTAGLEKMESFTQTIRRTGHTAGDRVIGITEIGLSKEVAYAMGLGNGTTGYEIRSVRTLDGVPVILTVDVLRGDLLKDAKVLELRKNHESLLEFLEDELGITVGYSLMSLEALRAFGDLAALLEIPEGFPLVHLEGVVRARDGMAIYHSSNYFRSDKYRFNLVRRS